jgi:hypothetical protein
LATATGLVACSTSPSMLIFADNATFGLQLGSNTAASGGNVTLGYRNRSVAIVPMSVLDETGTAKALRSRDGSSTDAMSVFAIFDAASADRTSPLNTGQMFSTGVAAQQLTLGYMCRSNPTASECAAPATARPEPPGDSALASAKQAAVSASTAASAASAAETSARSAAASASAAATASTSVASVKPAPPDDQAPYQWPLVFGRTDVLGFDITGSAAEQGATFVFGYGVRNLALVPTYTPWTNGRFSGLYANSEDISRDAFSVLGQFNASTKTSQLGFNINRYFATGLAAQNLARGIAAAIAASAPASAAQ